VVIFCILQENLFFFTSFGRIGKPWVHMTDSTFGQSSITIAKGSKLTLVSDTSQAHIIDNGTWGNDGLPHVKVEPGAPVIKDEQFLDNTPKSFGPFNTPGTYQLYCTIHSNMNLTVHVK